MEPIRWEAFEYEHRHRGSDWFWALGIIAVAAALTAIILGNILFAIVIVIGAFVLALFAARRPELIVFEIHDGGIVIGNRLYPYQTLESFWIEEELGPPRIILHSKRLLVPQIVIPLPEDLPAADIRKVLIAKIEEEELSEPLSERLAEWFGL